jgi:hypothetical protein
MFDPISTSENYQIVPGEPKDQGLLAVQALQSLKGAN